MLCRDGTCCRLLIIIMIEVPLFLFIFPDCIACPCVRVRPYWWREVNIEQPYAI